MLETTQINQLSPRFWVLAIMIAVAVATRLLAQFAPGSIPFNFTPVESIALFGGAYFADRRLALLVPLAAMLLSDLIIGLHGLMLVVYGCIALTTLLGVQLHNRVNFKRVATYSVGSAIMFFIVTNFFVWLMAGMYPLSGSGLVECYIAAIPFFQNTLLGTIFWSAFLFGGFELLQRQFPILTPAAA